MKVSIWDTFQKQEKNSDVALIFVGKHRRLDPNFGLFESLSLCLSCHHFPCDSFCIMHLCLGTSALLSRDEGEGRGPHSPRHQDKDLISARGSIKAANMCVNGSTVLKGGSNLAVC